VKSIVRAALGAGALASLAALASAAGPDRTKPPSAAAPRPVRLPPLQKMALGNGLPVILLDVREVPVVEVALVVRAGAASDPQGRSGAAAMTAEMLDEATGGRDALAIADALDLLGAELRTSCGWDASHVRLHVPAARFQAALPLFADVALRPALRQKDLDRLRREALTELLQAREEPRRIAAFALDRAVFGEGHRYGQPLRGDAASIQALKTAELRAFHTRHYRPENAALVVVGTIDAATLLPQLEKTFGAWQKGGQPNPGIADAAPSYGRQLWLIDRPGAAQSVIRIGRVAPGRATPDFHALQVMNTLLGGSFTSRLNDNLREQHGYAYGASSRFDYRRAAGLFVAASDVQTPSTADALREFMSELQRIRTPARKDEVERARAFLAAGYASEFETTREIAAKLAEQFVFALLEDEFTSFVPKALDVDAKAVQRVATASIDPGNLAIVVVGDRAKIERGLQQLDLAAINVLSVEQLMGPPPKIEAPPKLEQ
jgi:predicted Zn-dependent peptidase